MKVKIERLRRVSQAAGINTAFLRTLFVTTNAFCMCSETGAFLLNILQKNYITNSKIIIIP